MEIIDFDDCPRSGIFYGGRAGRKLGVLIDGEPWILKFPRPGRELAGSHVPSYTSSPVSEWLGSHIYESLGIPAHKTVLGYREGHVVCACKDFTYGGKSLYEFAQLKTEMSDDQTGFEGSPSDGSVLWLSDVLATISQLTILRSIPGVIERFWDMFVVDALLKNPDRNNGNWGILSLPEGGYELAPVYDNGSCLFSKRTDSVARRRLEDEAMVDQDAIGTTISCYVMPDAKDGRPRHIHPFDYMRASSDRDLAESVSRISSIIDFRAIDALIDEIPAEYRGRIIMGDSMRESHKRLIRERVEKGLAPTVRRNGRTRLDASTLIGRAARPRHADDDGGTGVDPRSNGPRVNVTRRR